MYVKIDPKQTNTPPTHIHGRHPSRGTLADSQDAREFYLDQAIAHLDRIAKIHRRRWRSCVIPFPQQGRASR